MCPFMEFWRMDGHSTTEPHRGNNIHLKYWWNLVQGVIWGPDHVSSSFESIESTVMEILPRAYWLLWTELKNSVLSVAYLVVANLLSWTLTLHLKWYDCSASNEFWECLALFWKGCGVGVETGFEVGPGRPFLLESTSELDSVKLCKLRLRSGVADYVLSANDNCGRMVICPIENIEIREEN